MLHFSCDRCGQTLGEQRFVAKLEAYPAFDPDEIEEEDLEVDHLEEVAEMLRESGESGSDDLQDCSSKTLRFDLCPECYDKVLKDPLGREAFRRMNFSEN